MPYEDIVKGFDLGDDRFVTVSREELRELQPQKTHTIEIAEFFDLPEIDPVFYEKSYYVAPQRNVGAEKPYALLLRAMRESDKIGIARLVLRTKEHLAAIRPMGEVLGLETLFYLDEVRQPGEIDNVPGGVEVSDREIAIATQLIDTLSAAWAPERYRDTFRERVLELIQGKTAQVQVREPETAPASRVSDLMDALKASVEAAKQAKRRDAAQR